MKSVRGLLFATSMGAMVLLAAGESAAQSESGSASSGVMLELVNEVPEREVVLEARIVDEEQVRYRGSREAVSTRLVTEPLCGAPCGVRLLRPRVVRIAGEGVAETEWFTLDAHARRLTVTPGSSAARTGGLVLGGIGILTTVVSFIATIAVITTGNLTTPTGWLWMGSFWGVSAALTIPGGFLYFGNATRVVDDLQRRY